MRAKIGRIFRVKKLRMCANKTQKSAAATPKAGTMAESKTTITQSLNDESNLAVSKLLDKEHRRREVNRKRLRGDSDDYHSPHTPSKKRKIDDTTSCPTKPVLELLHDADNDDEVDENVLGFSSSDEDDGDGDERKQQNQEDVMMNANIDQKDGGTDNEYDLDLMEQNDSSNHNGHHVSDDRNYSNQQMDGMNGEHSLQNDPYWNLMQSINDNETDPMELDLDANDPDSLKKDNHHQKDKNNGDVKVSIEIDVADESMFNVPEDKKKKNSESKNAKKMVKKYQKWQRDQGVECTQAHLALLVYRARFRTLLSTDPELQCRMMSILPLKQHPSPDSFNGIFTEISFSKLRALMTWFLSAFGYSPKAPQFEIRCQRAMDRITCGLFQLTEFIEDVGSKSNDKQCSISHRNLLFIALLWSFKIPARCVHVLRPISHLVTHNKIFDANYTEIMDRHFKPIPCVCEQIVDVGSPSPMVDDQGDVKMVKSPKKKKSKKRGIWSENDDIYLWNHRDDKVDDLAAHFGRNNRAIRMRISCLLEPERAAYQRLHGDDPPVIDDRKKAVPRRPINIDINMTDNDADNEQNDIDGEDVEMEDGPKKRKSPRKSKRKKKEEEEPVKTSKDKKSKKSAKTKRKTKKERRLQQQRKCRKPNSMKRWSVEDDIYLWEYRDDPTRVLAQTFNRTQTSIEYRLEKLRDPESKEWQNLITELPSAAQSKVKKILKPMKSIEDQRPDFSYLGADYVYDTKKGTMCECVEVWIADRKEWVHVLLDKGRIHFDCTENNLHQCDCERKTNKFSYCIAVNQFGGISDVTPRYTEIWSQALKKRVMHKAYYDEMIQKWKDENEQIAFQYGWSHVIEHKLWREIMDCDHSQIEQCIQSEPIPETVGLLNNHPLYVIEKFVKQREIIYPKDESQIIGTVGNGKNKYSVYPIGNLQDIHTRGKWFQLGYVVKDGETAVKQLKTSHMSRSEEEFTDYFGLWQCMEYVAPTIGPKDKLPKNVHGNVELWSDDHLPKGCVHITRPNVIHALKRMKIDFAKAMVGFEARKCMNVPVYNGFVIHESHEVELHRIADEMDEKRKVRAEEKEMKEMCGLWRMLVQGIMVQHQLENQAREKEQNKQLVTTKEFNEMMDTEEVEDL